MHICGTRGRWVNLFHAEMILENFLCLHFLLLLNIDMVRVAKKIPEGHKDQIIPHS